MSIYYCGHCLSIKRNSKMHIVSSFSHINRITEQLYIILYEIRVLKELI